MIGALPLVLLEVWIFQALTWRRWVLGIYIALSAISGAFAVIEVSRVGAAHGEPIPGVLTLVGTYFNLVLLWPFLVYWNIWARL